MKKKRKRNIRGYTSVMEMIELDDRFAAYRLPPDFFEQQEKKRKSDKRKLAKYEAIKKENRKLKTENSKLKQALLEK